MINLEGLSKAQVLSALYNHAKLPSYSRVLEKNALFQLLNMIPEYPFPYDKKIYFSSRPMTVEDAQFYIDIYSDHEDQYHFHFVCTRHLGVDLTHDEFDPTHYNLANGEMAAQKAISLLRIQLNIPEPELFQGLRTGWMNEFSESEQIRLENQDDESSLSEQESLEEENLFSGLKGGWLRQQETSQIAEKVSAAKANPSLEKKKSKTKLKGGWFDQYSAEEELVNSDANVKHLDSNAETVIPSEEESDEFGKTLKRGWFNAYSQSCDERANQSESSESDEEKEFVVLFSKMKINK